MSSSKEILAEADAIIHGERAESYGPAEESFDRIGRLWSAYLDVPISGYDVAMLMTLLKVSRAKTDVRRDTFVDISGYSALAERCAVQSGRMLTEADLKPIQGAIDQAARDRAAAGFGAGFGRGPRSRAD